MNTINVEQRIKNAYFKWLCNLVKDGKPDPDQTYAYLLSALYNRDFYGLVGNDEDRGDHGVMLRFLWYESVKSRGLYDEDVVDAVLDGPCRFLEMMIGLCIKMEDMSAGFVENDSIGYWFWRIIDNMDLAYLSDDRYIECSGTAKVDESVEMVLDRSYDFSGKGGMFPLKKPEKDQRTVEIWYQLSAYLMENVNYG